VKVKLKVDDEDINMNEFVAQILSGTISGTVTSLHGITKDWKEIKLEIKR